MKKIIKFFLVTALVYGFSNSNKHYSKMKFGAGFLRCEIDGDTVTIGLQTDNGMELRHLPK